MTVVGNTGLLWSVRYWGALGLLLTTVLFFGCAHKPPQPLQPAAQTLDDLYAAVARQVPEFGGMFLSSDGQILQIYLTDVSPAKLAQAQKAIVAVFGREIISPGGIKALQGQYGFLQLKEWYSRMVGPVLSTPGVTLTDIDEAKNRLGIGIETRDVEVRVVEQLRKLGIPREGVVIEVTGPIVPLHTVPPPFPPQHTVHSPFSPRQGGYIETRLLCNQTGTGITQGTLGVNARRVGMGLAVPGFVTNSHNTEVLWSVDTNAGFPPAEFYQAPGYYPSELVGVEAVDPPGFTGAPCPTGLTCRHSDSAFVSYYSGVASNQGRIARTTGLTTSTANPVLTVAHGFFNPGEFRIVARPSKPYLPGLTLDKVGRTTGWTQGQIELTCVNTPQPPPFIIACPSTPTSSPGTLLCQYTVAHPSWSIVDGGDSGSPVFRRLPSPWWNPFLHDVELYGILWGRFFGNYKKFFFSPIGGVAFQQTGVQTDLGSLMYCHPGSNPPC